MSFANLGVGDTSGVAFTAIASRTKSYFVDVGNQLVIWNPSTMESLGAIALPAENETALVPRYMSYLTVRGIHVLVNSFMSSPERIGRCTRIGALTAKGQVRQVVRVR